MKVQDIMTPDVQSCGPDTNLSTAAKMMWDSDCGALPVLSPEGKVLGMVTDRDICMSVATKNKAPFEVTVGETISGKAFSCRPWDDVHAALELMKRERIRRLPVVDDDGILQGILALNDLVLNAQGGKAKAQLSNDDVMDALKAISSHRVLTAA